MCQVFISSADPKLTTDVARKTPGGTSKTSGSRRRRLWDLEGRMHCPIVGVCLPVPVLRKVVETTFRGKNIDKDYDLHSGAVSECRSRTKLAEALQRELEQRYVIAVRLASQHKTTEALQKWWMVTCGQNLPGALWATVTHPRCSEVLEQQVFGEVHMIQHQIGTVQRVDQARLEALVQENVTLARELAAIQTRSTQLQQEQTARIEAQQCLIMRLRADVLGRDTRLNILQEEVASLQAAVPGLKCRVKQAQELHLQAQHIHRLQRDLLLERQECERRGRLLEAQEQERHHFELRNTDASSSEALVQQPSSDQPVLANDLADRAVLCVGGRTASVPLYRHIVERTGGRFIHHDGGEQESLSKLDATLAAADLVICQTGCISHNAYWRVKDHCKRTGKQCVFMENPGTAGLKRALSELQTSGVATM